MDDLAFLCNCQPAATFYNVSRLLSSQSQASNSMMVESMFKPLQCKENDPIWRNSMNRENKSNIRTYSAHIIDDASATIILFQYNKTEINDLVRRLNSSRTSYFGQQKLLVFSPQNRPNADQIGKYRPETCTKMAHMADMHNR